LEDPFLSFPFGEKSCLFWFIHESHAIPVFFLNNAEMLGRMNGDLQRAKVIAHRRWVAKMGGGKKQAVGKGNCLKARVKIDMCL